MDDDAADGPQTIKLTRFGVASKVALSKTSLVFGLQLLGTTSGSRIAKLTNQSSTDPLTLGEIAVSGDYFLVETTNECPNFVVIPPKSSCNLAVKFSPTSVGTRYGTITIDDSDPASPHVVGLSGTGTAAKLSAAKLKFGSVPEGQSSKVKTVTLSNVGSSPLSIAGITIVGTNAEDFAQANTCGSSLAAGSKCFINVTLKPTTTGTRTATINVADSDPTSPQTVTLIGTGT